MDEGRIVPAVQCNAEALPFPSRSFDCVCVAFGLRNVTRKDVALAEMRRISSEIEVPQIANMVFGGLTPALPQSEFAKLGFGKPHPASGEVVVTGFPRGRARPSAQAASASPFSTRRPFVELR